jgi:hypothetical protein
MVVCFLVLLIREYFWSDTVKHHIGETMKTGKTLMELAAEVERQQESKVDFVADTRQLSLHAGELLMGAEQMPLTDHAHGQVAARLNIPKQYYDRMREEQPELLETNVNTWFQENPKKQMVRTLDGEVRAFLSDRYRALDNFDLLSATLPVLGEHALTVVSSEVTAGKMYLKVIKPELEREITKSSRKGDIVRGGLVISNSEIGIGGLQVQSFLEFLACTNGMTMPTGMKKYHIGKRQSSDEQIQRLLTDRTKQANDTAFWMTVKDVVKASLSREIFNGHIDIVEETTGVFLDADPIKVVENVQRKFSLTDQVTSTIKQSLIQGGDLSQYGYTNAVTEAANNLNDYETASELERIGGKIITLDRKDWEVLAMAS